MPQSETSTGESPDQGREIPAKPDSEQAPERRSLVDLLREENDDEKPEQGEQGEAGESSNKAKPKGLHDLAERLGAKPEDLYKIAVPMANGQEMTIGQLKDQAATSGDLTERELRFEEDRTRREGELAAAKQELQDLIQALPREALKPELLQKIGERRAEYLKREKALVMDAIPEWRDEAKRTEDIGGMIEHLKAYGFPAGYLGTIADHRTIRYIRDNWRREQRVRRALEQVEKGAPPKSTKSKPAGSAPAKPRNTSNRTRTDARSQLLDLLN